MNCQHCHQYSAEWAWQPFGPDDSILSFTLLGSHYRGFPVLKVCDNCKLTVESEVMFFSYRGHDYIANPTLNTVEAA